MWKLWAKTNIIFLILLTVSLLGVFALHGRKPDWPVVCEVGPMAALAFSIVTCFLLMRYQRERVRKHVAYWAAMQEIVDEMARQSLTETSVFLTAFQRGDGGETVLVTSQDNPNRQVLEQMANLGIARRISSEAIGEAPRKVVTLRYGFDFKGMGLLFSLVDAAAKRRAFFEGRRGSM